MTPDEKRIVEWLPFKTAPKDGTPFLFCEAGSEPVYIGRYAQPTFEGVREANCLCYFSYTNTIGKNLFRHRGMIKCGLNPTHFALLPETPSGDHRKD